MTPVEALNLALSEELRAIQLYEKLSLEHSSVKETFLFLVNEEYRHKSIVEKKISEISRY